MTISNAPALPKQVADALAAIAREELGFETLETRRSDSLDFRDCAVWCVQEALRRAYELGKASQA